MTNNSRSFSATPDDIANQQALLAQHRQTLRHYLYQEASSGSAFLPPSVANGIIEVRSHIRRIKKTLRDWNIECPDHPDDDPIPIIIPPQSPVQQVSDGLDALADLMRTPRVRDAVNAFRTEFFVSRDQIAQLADYKLLHDQLHELQFRCYNPINRQIKRFPADEFVYEDFSDHDMTFYNITIELQATLARAASAASERTPGTHAIAEEAKWVKTLVDIHHDMHQAIVLLDVQQLQDVIRRMNRVLGYHPGKINTRLNTIARTLRLSDLIDALANISEMLARPGFNIQKVEQFERGLQAIKHLQETLYTQIQEHDSWQEVDSELRRIEGSLIPSIDELEESWPTLKHMVEQLCERPDEWAILLRGEGLKLEHAIKTQDSVQMRHCFHRFYTQAGYQFYRVDTSLKKLCDDLRSVGDPLESMLRMIS